MESLDMETENVADHPGASRGGPARVLVGQDGLEQRMEGSEIRRRSQDRCVWDRGPGARSGDDLDELAGPAFQVWKSGNARERDLGHVCGAVPAEAGEIARQIGVLSGRAGDLSDLACERRGEPEVRTPRR